MSIKTKIPAGYTFIEGRSAAKAQELLGALDASGVEGSVLTTSFGYLVPEGVLGAEAADADADAAAAQAEADAQAAAQAEAEAAAQAEADAAAQAEADAAAQAAAGDNENGVQFDPAKAKVEEVLEYLNGADDDERKRVLDAEKAGQNRVTITREYEEGAK